MEPSHQTRKITGRILLLVLLGATAWAACAQFASPLASNLAGDKKAPVQVTVLTKPAMFVSYNPQTRKASVRVLGDKLNQKSPLERTQKLLEAENIAVKNPKFFEPADTERETFWNGFKHALSAWRHNPFLAARAGWNYLSAWHNRRTNLSPAEFALLSMELTQLEPSDFAVTFPARKKRASRKPEPVPAIVPDVADMAPLALKDRPIIVEVLNASGRKGLALELTQYLRDQNEKGQLRVDVLQYDNYPSTQNSSWLDDYSGRLVQVNPRGRAVGITGEIRTGAAPNVICDTRIILGKDFKMPL